MQDETNLRPGFDLGAASGEDHIVFNHLAFNVLIHKAHDAHANAVKDPRRGPQVGPRGVWEVVGLEVMPCSIQRASGEPLEQIPCKPWGSRHNPPPQVVLCLCCVCGRRRHLVDTPLRGFLLQHLE